MNEKITTWNSGFTFEYNKFTYSISTPVILESDVDTSIKIKIDAIWDTGSHVTIIRPEVAEALELSCISKTTLNGIFGKTEYSNMYTLNMYFPNKDKHNIIVTEAYPKGCDMLIGMDVITLGDMAITNYNGKTIFTFRIPSKCTIDFEKE